jgi:cytochrome c biogenesis protein CcmG/thiol:disulfide interchange protein DsbE
MRYRVRLVAQGAAIGLVALLFILLAWSLLHRDGGSLAAAANRGELPIAPDFTLDRIDEDGQLTLSSLRGKVVVVNYWASYCYPCRAEAPFLETVWRRDRERDVVVVGVDWQDFRGDARRFMRRYDVTFPVVHDGPGHVGFDYGITGLPETYVLDRDGRVVEAFIGAINTDEDKARLRSAIAEAHKA